jgi:hypothetical protein
VFLVSFNARFLGLIPDSNFLFLCFSSLNFKFSLSFVLGFYFLCNPNLIALIIVVLQFSSLFFTVFINFHTYIRFNYA